MTRDQLRVRLIALAMLSSPLGDEPYTNLLRRIHDARPDGIDLTNVDVVALVAELCRTIPMAHLRPLGFYEGAYGIGQACSLWRYEPSLDKWSMLKVYPDPAALVEVILTEPILPAKLSPAKRQLQGGGLVLIKS